MCVYVYVFIELRVTVQSGPVMLRVISLIYSHPSVSVSVCLCVVMRMCVFIKLHMTTQSSPLISSFYATRKGGGGGGVCVYVCVCVCVNHWSEAKGLLHPHIPYTP